MNELTPKETRILARLAAGETQKAIAESLGLLDLRQVLAKIRAKGGKVPVRRRAS
jgi:FixJ family two-component response regulator